MRGDRGAAIASQPFGRFLILMVGGHGIDWVFNDFVYNGLVLVSALSCVVRGIRVRERRSAWLLLGAGLVCWTASEIYDSAYLAHLKDPPYPSLSDLLSLLFYPASCVALLLLARGRMRAARASLWLDGLVAALAVCALGEMTVDAVGGDVQHAVMEPADADIAGIIDVAHRIGTVGLDPMCLWTFLSSLSRFHYCVGCEGAGSRDLRQTAHSWRHIKSYRCGESRS